MSIKVRIIHLVILNMILIVPVVDIEIETTLEILKEGIIGNDQGPRAHEVILLLPHHN